MNNTKCPNKRHPDFQRLVRDVPEMAYTIWDKNNSYGIESASNGKPSILYSRLLALSNDERAAAVAKARIYTKQYEKVAKDSIIPLDENGEPIPTEAPNGWVHVNGFTLLNKTEKSAIKDDITNNHQNEIHNPTVDEKVKEVQKSITERRLELLQAMHEGKGAAFIKALDNKVEKASTAIISGINSRIYALKQHQTSPVVSDRIATLERELRQYEAAYEDLEDQKLIVSFIANIDKEAKPSFDRIKKAWDELGATGKFPMRTAQLVQLKTDFLGFYSPLTDQIYTELFTGRYFDNMNEDQKAFIKESLEDARSAFAQMEGMYNDMLLNRVAEVLIAHGDAANSATIRDYFSSHLNHTGFDISAFHTFLGGLKNVNDEALTLLHSLVVNLNNGIARASIDRIADFVPIAKEAGDTQGFYEKDSKGKKTGYLVRDRNFGEWEANWESFQREQGPAPINDQEALKKWYQARNRWHAEQTERQYTPEYYELFNNLSKKAREARDEVQQKINRLIRSITDVDGGLNKENLSVEQWAELETAYMVKKALSIKYYPDGTAKAGTDLDVANELKALNKVLGENLRFKMNKAKFDKVAAKKKAELSPEKYKLWYDRSTRISYTEAFMDGLKKMDKADYGEAYANLNDDKREFLSLFRTNRNMQVDASRMSEDAKAKVAAMDKELARIRREHKGPRTKSDFGEIAEIVKTDRYNRDKQAALSRGEEAYNNWRLDNHYTDSRGILQPYSYYTYMKPKAQEHLETVPTSEFSETDEDSPFFNKNFDKKYGEKYIPKKSLYDNATAYKELTNQPKKKALYDATVEAMRESNNNCNMPDRSPYLLPQNSGTWWAFVKANSSIIKGTMKYLEDKFTTRGDDLEYKTKDQVRMYPNGEKLRSLPRHYIARLQDPATISNDLVGMVAKYIEMGIRFKHRSEAMAEFELIAQWVDQRAYTPKEGKGITGGIKSLSERVMRIFTKSKEQTNSQKRVRMLLDMHLYGERMTDMTKKVLGREININKIASHLKGVATVSKLGMSPTVWAKNISTSLHQNFVEGIGGKHYDSATSLKATRELAQQYLEITAQIGDYAAENKVISLMNYNRIVRSVSSDFNRLNYNRFARAAMNHLWYSGMTAGDYMIKSHNLVAVYMYHKYIPGEGFMTKYEYGERRLKNEILKFATEKEYADFMLRKDPKKEFKDKPLETKRMQEVFDRINSLNFKQIRKEAEASYAVYDTPNLYDVVEAKGITVGLKDEYKSLGKYITPEFQNKITNTAQYLNQRADSQLSEEEKGMMHRNVYLSYLMMLRQWIVQAVDDRFLKQRQWNPLTNDWDEAMYKAAYRAGLQVPFQHNVRMLQYYSRLATGRDAGYKPIKQQMTANERYYVRRTMADLTWQIVYQAVLALMIRPWWEDDQNDWLKSWILLLFVSTLREEANPYDIIDTMKSLTSVTPASSEFENFTEGLTLLLTDPDRDVTYGPYMGWPKWQQKFFKLTPFSNLYQLQDPNVPRKYIESQLTTGNVVERSIRAIKDRQAPKNIEFETNPNRPTYQRPVTTQRPTYERPQNLPPRPRQ